MASTKPRILLRLAYEKAAEAYLRSLPPEHFMEAVPQATQRKITLESLDLVHARRPEMQVFNELLVQYTRPGTDEPGQVVPDNMIVVHPEPLRVVGSYDMPFQPVGPLAVLEYVSKSSQRKDYDDNMVKYERELKVPYYLLFYPDAQDLTLYHHTRRKYTTVRPNAEGRLAIAELELEVALLDGWVRFWYQGELMPLPADLQRALAETRSQLDQERRARRAAEEEVARLRAEIEQLRQPPGTAS